MPEADVRIAGRPEVGQTLTARTSLARPVRGVTYRYRWLRDGEPIPGATRRTYSPVRADVAREVSVRVTATKPGRAAAGDTSRSVGVRPVVGTGGAPRVGRTLTARVFVPEGARATYRWQAAEAPAPGEERVFRQVGTGPGYTLRARDARQRVRLVVTLGGRGFTEVTARSEGRYVEP